jgi:S1-C subfamily serine protease
VHLEIPRKQNRKLVGILLVMIVVASLCAAFVGYWVGHLLASNEVDELQEQLTSVQKQVDSLQAASATSNQEQSDVQVTIDAIQTQLSTILYQISNLQGSDLDSNIQSQLSELEEQVNEIKATMDVTHQNITYFLGENVSLSQLFEEVRESVVVIQALASETDIFGRRILVTVQGSGFVNNFTGEMMIITNNHVVENAIDINVTFSNGNTYSVVVEGASSDTDVAVLTTDAPQSEYKPLSFVSSSTLKVGDPVTVVGTPYGLAGSMSNGIVSALNRTITTDQTTMTNIIQTTAPLNPGNSGGPMMNYLGDVVGMATAIVEDSQGLGFAIPSDTILQDILAFKDQS